MIRSLNGLRTDSRSLNGLSSDKLTLQKLKADLPLEYDVNNYTYSIKGLNSLGSANQILKMNSGGTALEFANDNNTEYTATLPLSISPSNVISTAFTPSSSDTLTNKQMSYDQLTGVPTIPNLTTATDFGTSAPSKITIGSSSRQMELEATNFTFTDTNGTSILKITDSDVEINGADFGIKARSSSDPPRLYFWDSDRSHYIALQGQEIGSNVNLTLPHITATLAYNGQNISGFTNDTQYINLSSLETAFNFGNLTTTNLTIGRYDNSKTTILRGSDIELQKNGATFTLPASSGQLATTSQVPATSANSSNFGTTASANITLGNVSYTNTINGSLTTINSKLSIVSADTDTLGYVISALAPNKDDGEAVQIILGQSDTTGNCFQLSFNYQGDNNANTNATLGLRGSGNEHKLKFKQNGNIHIDDELRLSNVNTSGGKLSFAERTDIGLTTISLLAPDTISGSDKIINLPNIDGTMLTENSTATLTNKSGNISMFSNDAGYITESNNYWELSSSKLTPKIDTYNVIIGQKANGNSNNVELLVYGDAEIKQKLFSSSNSEIYLDFDTTYDVKCFGKYYAPTTTSYNMSFQNTQTSSTYPFIGVRNDGAMVLHINGVGDAIDIQIDRDVSIYAGDIVGENTAPTAFGSKKRMKDVYCRHLYSEAQIFSNGTASSAYSLYYENQSNGSNYTKLQATESIGTTNTLTLPEGTGTLISSASNNLCADATSTISIASSSNPRHLDIYTPEIEVSTLGDTNAFIELRSGTGNASSSYTSQLKFYNKNNTKSAFMGLDTNSYAYMINNASTNGESKVNLVNYGVFCNGYYTSTRAYPLTFQSSINSTYYAHFYTTSGHSNGLHISSVGDSWETLLSRDIKYYDTDFSGETNGVASYAKLQMGDIYMEDLFAEALNYTSATQVSDARLKKNLKPIENAIDTLNKLTPLLYDKKVKEKDDLWGKEYQKECGLIAQNVYNEVPELKFIVNNVAEDISSNFDSSGNLVRDCCGWDIVEDQPRREYPIEVDASGNPTENSGKLIQEATYKKVKNPNKKLSINYEELSAYLIKGIQELSEQNKKQQEQIDLLLSKLNV